MNDLTNRTQVSGLIVNYPHLAATYGVLLLLVAGVAFMHSISALSKAVSGLLLLNAKQHRTTSQWSRSEVGDPSEPR